MGKTRDLFIPPPSHTIPTPLDHHRAPDLSSMHHTANFQWLSSFTQTLLSLPVMSFIHFPVCPYFKMERGASPETL